MTLRTDILNDILNESSDSASNYSHIMRKLRKTNPDLVKSFMKEFKLSFDEALDEDHDLSPEAIALMTALKKINYQSNK